MVGALVESMVIDTLHWRHLFFFLGVGLGLSCWAVRQRDESRSRRAAPEKTNDRNEANRAAAAGEAALDEVERRRPATTFACLHRCNLGSEQSLIDDPVLGQGRDLLAPQTARQLPPVDAPEHTQGLPEGSRLTSPRCLGARTRYIERRARPQLWQVLGRARTDLWRP